MPGQAEGIDFVGRAILESLRQSLAARLPRGAGKPFEEIARDYLQVRTDEVPARVVPFALRDIQKRYLAEKDAALSRRKRPRFLLLKYRRGGFTTLEQGLSYWLASRHRNVNVITLAQNGKTTDRIFRIALLMHERDVGAPERKGVNAFRLEFPGLNSIFYLGTAGSHSVARGDTLSRVHWSEVAFSCEGGDQISKQRDLLAGLTEAASHGEVVLETTPNGSELFRELYEEAKRGQNDWTPIFFPWFADSGNRLALDGGEAERSLQLSYSDEEKELVARHGLDAEQICWRRLKQREHKNLFYQEFPEDDQTCWLLAGICYFDAKLVMTIRDECRAPAMVDGNGAGLVPANSRHLPGGHEVEWEPPQPDVDYVMGVDTSEGLPGCDPNGLGVMRKDTGAQVFALHGFFSPRALADHVVRVARHYNDALVGVERENHGHAVLQRVIDLGYDSPHHCGGSLYYLSTANPSGVDDRPAGRAGWSTNARTRDSMLSELRDWLEAPGVEGCCFDRLFLNECLTFRQQSDGRFAADGGCHDDAVMKWAIANQMRRVDWRRESFSVHQVSRWR